MLSLLGVAAAPVTSLRPDLCLSLTHRATRPYIPTVYLALYARDFIVIISCQFSYCGIMKPINNSGLFRDLRKFISHVTC